MENIELGKDWGVYIRHFRLPQGSYKNMSEQEIVKKATLRKGPDVFPRGGMTWVIIYEKANPSNMYFGMTVCSIRDNFSKRVGREIATQRAIALRDYLKSNPL